MKKMRHYNEHYLNTKNHKKVLWNPPANTQENLEEMDKLKSTTYQT